MQSMIFEHSNFFFSVVVEFLQGRWSEQTGIYGRTLF